MIELNQEQIILLIINERLYNIGQITKEEKDKISISIERGDYEKYLC